MYPASPEQTERLVQFSRRQLWMALIFLLVIGAIHLGQLTALSVPDPLPVVVASGAWIGAVVFLASLLWHDR
jgi:hypothetical protein